MTQQTASSSPAPEGVETPWPASKNRKFTKIADDLLGLLIKQRTEANADIKAMLLKRLQQIEEVCWTASEIRGVLNEAGFDKIRSWDAATLMKDFPVFRRGCRTFYLARKSLG